MAEPIGLARECVLFARHITGAPPPDPVVACYVNAHTRGSVLPPAPDALDAMLLRAASSARPMTPLADIYARLFRKGGTLRRKLVLLAAILESTGATYSGFEPPPASRSARVFASLAGSAAVFLVQAIVALIVFAPPHAALLITGRTRRRTASVVDAP